jgi:small subunit ribosomal protein S4
MARYLGPKIKISRRFGVKLGLRTNEEAFTKRPFKPGQHGPNGRRGGRVSEYGLQLQEKQKAKYIYGMLEKQFRRYYDMATKSDNIGLALMQSLETRLDTVLFRAGLTLTQNQARQYVSHGHVLVDGKKVSIPSFAVRPGMKVTLEKSLATRTDEQRGTGATIPTWVSVSGATATVLDMPTKEQIPSIVNEQLIVEFYSR